MEKNIHLNHQPSTFKHELFRKTIHISSSAIPIGYYFLEKKLVLEILLPITSLMLVIELLKYKWDFLYNLYVKLFKGMLREYEFDRKVFRINGASWVFIGDIICIIIFPKFVAITGMLLLSLADSLSAIVGQVFAKKYYSKNRSYLGSATFLIIGIIIVLITPKFFYIPLEYYIGFIAVIITTLVDAISLPVDDNLVIPIISSSVLYLLYLLILLQ